MNTRAMRQGKIALPASEIKTFNLDNKWFVDGSTSFVIQQCQIAKQLSQETFLYQPIHLQYFGLSKNWKLIVIFLSSINRNH